MTIFISVLGILTAVFFVLAATNGLKPYLKQPFMKKIYQNHRIFGMIAAFLAMIHMVVAISSGELRVTGALALLSLFSTSMLGMLFSEKKSKALYVAHRIIGPVTFILIFIHIIFNSSI
ncbi:hypothetical protein N7603_07500 [Acholeplasma vituli]|uniref:DUF4405 domain-containing protein n=1 Tax=Paracholeplasma vituli TaxID=69473 RepID=A0ABT2PX20_9MOLU|nr:hypothetical protein [Paracholeplasma vituli]MCU0105501.1 hypothetical protein [Paracholeplasma vituli]